MLSSGDWLLSCHIHFVVSAIDHFMVVHAPGENTNAPQITIFPNCHNTDNTAKPCTAVFCSDLLPLFPRGTTSHQCATGVVFMFSFIIAFRKQDQYLQWLTVGGGALWRWTAVQTHHVGSCLLWGGGGVGSDCWTDSVGSNRNSSGSTRKSSGWTRWPYPRQSLPVCHKANTVILA